MSKTTRAPKNEICKKCKFGTKCKTNRQVGIKYSARSTPRVMIIQQLPSRVDDSWGALLSADGGAKIRWLLNEAGIKPEDVYYTTAVKCYSKKASDIKPVIIESCFDYLAQEIIDIKPELIITLGKASLEALKPVSSVKEMRGHFDDFTLRYEYTGKDEETKEKVIKSTTFKCKLLPTLDLQASFSEWKYNAVLKHDFKKAGKFLYEGVIDRTPDPKINVVMSLDGLNRLVEKYKHVSVASSDFETTGFDFLKNFPFVVGYSSEVGTADVVFLEEYKNEHTKKWTKEEKQIALRVNTFVRKYKKEIHEAVRTINGYKHIKWVFHNGKFDIKFAIVRKYPYYNFYFDTMNADSLVDENMGHTLNECCERREINYGAYDTKLWKYTNKGEKTKKSYQNVPPKMIMKYLGYDVDGCLRLYHKEVEELKKEKLLKHFLEVKMQTIKDVTKLEFIGFKADVDKIHETSKALEDIMNETRRKLLDFTGMPDLNTNSQKQLNDFMIARGYPLEESGMIRTANGLYSTSTEEMDKLRSFKDHECSKLPDLVQSLAKMVKLKGTYIDGTGEDVIGGMLKHLDRNNRIHTSYNLHSPVTGRESTKDPSVQVWPRPIKGVVNIRNMVIPTSNEWALFEADYKALEIHIVAYLSKDPVLLKQLWTGTDLHCFNAVAIGSKLNLLPQWVKYEHMMIKNGKAEDLTSCTAEEIEAYKNEILEKDPEDKLLWKELRTRAKSLAFGLNYGKEALSFAEEFGVTEREAQDMIDGYFETYSVMKAWRDSIVEQAKTKGYVELMSGRKRRFHSATEWLNSEFAERCGWSNDRTIGDISRQAMNFPVQGNAHEVFEPALIRVNRRFKKEGLKARIMFRIHDGILGECPKSERQLVAKILKEEMTTTLGAGTEYALTLGVDVDHYKWEWYGEKEKLKDVA